MDTKEKFSLYDEKRIYQNIKLFFSWLIEINPDKEHVLLKKGSKRYLTIKCVEFFPYPEVLTTKYVEKIFKNEVKKILNDEGWK